MKKKKKTQLNNILARGPKCTEEYFKIQIEMQYVKLDGILPKQ